MGRYLIRMSRLLCILAMCIAASLGHAYEKPVTMGMTTSMPGAGFGIDERGRLGPDGAVQLNIPVGYTLSKDQYMLGFWAGAAGGEFINLQFSQTVGFLSPGKGLSITGIYTDYHYPWTAHVQKQLWPETDYWPAVSAGVIDVSHHVERSYYVAATKRLARLRRRRQMVFRAATPAWPAATDPPSPDNPSTWGVMKLSGEAFGADAGAARDDEMLVPSSEYPVVLDGMVGREWEDAAQVRLELPDGQFFLLGAKLSSGVLYVVVAVPSDRQLLRGAGAELYFEVPRSARHELTSNHLRYKLQWDKRRKPRLLQFKASPVGGKWTDKPSEPDTRRPPERFSGEAGDFGDGLWRYPVFEFAIPLRELGVEGDGEEIGFCALVDLPRERITFPLDKRPEEQIARWPMGHAGSPHGKNCRFELRPDLWGDVVFGPKTVGEQRIGAPATRQAPSIDGRIDEEEWACADRRDVDLAPGVEQTIYVQRSRDHLYVASVWTAPTSVWLDQVVDVFVDPYGDGGFWPHADDRQLRIQPRGGDVKLTAYSWDEKCKQWRTRKRIPFQAASDNVASATGVQSATEVAIPLNALGLSTKASRNRQIGLGLRAEVTPILGRRVGDAPVVERPPGKSTYLTAAWGTGIYDHRVIYGISQPIGSFRGIAEWDGDQINIGLSGPIVESDKVTLTVGYNGVNERVDGGPLVGLSFGGGF